GCGIQNNKTVTGAIAMRLVCLHCGHVLFCLDEGSDQKLSCPACGEPVEGSAQTPCPPVLPPPSATPASKASPTRCPKCGGLCDDKIIGRPLCYSCDRDILEVLLLKPAASRVPMRVWLGIGLLLLPFAASVACCAGMLGFKSLPSRL